MATPAYPFHPPKPSKYSSTAASNKSSGGMGMGRRAPSPRANSDAMPCDKVLMCRTRPLLPPRST